MMLRHFTLFIIASSSIIFTRKTKEQGFPGISSVPVYTSNNTRNKALQQSMCTSHRVE